MNKEQLQVYYDKFIHLMTRLEHQNVKIIGLSTKYKSIQVGRAIANRLGIVEGIPTPAEVADIKQQIAIVSSDVMGIELMLKAVEENILMELGPLEAKKEESELTDPSEFNQLNLNSTIPKKSL